jgi:multicomponent Na+:H+ antiporter subunit C
MAYRSWQLTGHDEVQDDVEDAAIRRLARADAESRSYDDDGDDDEADSTPRPEVRP